MPKLCNNFLKFLFPPGPKELGKSAHNALPLRSITPFTEEYCWEDWRRDVKKDYPIRYFLTQTVSLWFFVKIIMPIQNLYWHLKDRFITKNYLVDIRQGYNGFDCYHSRYIDGSEKILFACFNILRDFIKHGLLSKQYSIYSNSSYEQKVIYDEALDIYDYWIFEREREYKAVDDLFIKFTEMSKNDKDEHIKAKKAWINAEGEFSKTEDNMLIRLVKIRRSLWI